VSGEIVSLGGCVGEHQGGVVEPGAAFRSSPRAVPERDLNWTDVQTILPNHGPAD
jgi:hypothetical protein